MRTQLMYMEHRVEVGSGSVTANQRTTLDEYIGDGWRVFATHAVVDRDRYPSIIYVLVTDVELDDDE